MTKTVIFFLLALPHAFQASGQFQEMPGYRSFDKIGGYDVGAILFLTKKKISSPILELKQGGTTFSTRELSPAIPYFESKFTSLKRTRKNFRKKNYKLLSVDFKAHSGHRLLANGGITVIRQAIANVTLAEAEDLRYSIKMFKRPHVITEVIHFDSAQYNFRFSQQPTAVILSDNELMPTGYYGEEFEREYLHVNYHGQNLYFKDHKITRPEYIAVKKLLYNNRTYQSVSLMPLAAGIATLGDIEALKVRTTLAVGVGANLEIRNAGYSIFGISVRYFHYGMTTQSYFDTFRKDFHGEVENTFVVNSFQVVGKFNIWNLDSPIKPYVAATYCHSYLHLESVESSLLNPTERDNIVKSSDERDPRRGVGLGAGIDYIVGGSPGADPTRRRSTLCLEAIVYKTALVNHNYTFNLYGNTTVDRQVVQAMSLQILLSYAYKLRKW